jgi:hypothetical protein
VSVIGTTFRPFSNSRAMPCKIYLNRKSAV